MKTSGFFAFASGIPLVVESIRAGILELGNRRSALGVESWEEIDIPGRFVSTEILAKIASADALIADISRLNFNVTYEIGYAIGSGKRVLIVRHRAITEATPTIQEVGIFDTLGYKTYSTSEELADFLAGITDLKPIALPSKRNEKTPIYLVQPKTRTDYDGIIIAAVKKSLLYFRSFDPTEKSRLPGPEAISMVGESYGVILHFLPDEYVDAPIHNIRSAFVAGLADGMERRSLYIQTGETPVPIDLRDFVTQCRHPDDFKKAIGSLAERVYEDRSATSLASIATHQSFLATSDLGASAAENEITSLGEYYVEIDSFRRAMRREVRLVTGRKGSGKTAIFFMLRDIVRARRQNVVLDLKPEGYQLLKLKDTVIRLLSSGTAEHTLTAFWEYLLWLEVCYKLLEKDQELHKRDHRLFEPYQGLKASYITNDYSSEGDFAERLKALLRDIMQELETRYGKERQLELTTPQITGLVYRHDFTKLRAQIIAYLHFKGELWLLFDNLDKGWSSHGVVTEDLVILRALMEATRKIERDLTKVDITAHTIIFLRNDVFEHLIDTTADRGKETRANVDWDDAEMLREMVRRRLVRALPEDQHNVAFSEIWPQICVPIIDGQDSAQYLIDRCMMRPRSLLDLIGHCRGYALNLQHSRIEKDDISKGCDAFSNDLLSELDLEIRDVLPSAENLLYAFIGATRLLSRPTLEDVLLRHNIPTDKLADIVSVLLWFGFLGFVWADGSHRYIYSFHYNMKVMDGSHKQMLEAGNIRYIVNPAFVPALGLQ